MKNKIIQLQSQHINIKKIEESRTMFNMQKMMKQAQEMQFKMEEMQEKLKDIQVEAESGGGMIKVQMLCNGVVQKIDIDESLVNSDKETLEDLIVAAINNTNEVKDERIKTETKSMMEGMGLPGDGTGMPF